MLTGAVSLPQVGTFTTQHGEYFLEPLLNAAGEEYDEEHNKPHLVYRHERHKDTKSANATVPCAASGNRVQTDFTACNHSLSDFRLQAPSSAVCFALRAAEINAALKGKLHRVTIVGSREPERISALIEACSCELRNWKCKSCSSTPCCTYFLLERSV